MKVLIADDEPAFCNLLEETLTRWGYEVIVTGRERGVAGPARRRRPETGHS